LRPGAVRATVRRRARGAAGGGGRAPPHPGPLRPALYGRRGPVCGRQGSHGRGRTDQPRHDPAAGPPVHGGRTPVDAGPARRRRDRAVTETRPAAAAADLGIGLLGCGTVGSAVVRLLQTNGEDIRRRTGTGLRLARGAAAPPAKGRGARLEDAARTPAAGGARPGGRRRAGATPGGRIPPTNGSAVTAIQ